MKKWLIIAIFTCIISEGYGQIQDGYTGLLLDSTDWIDSLPEITISQASLDVILPNEVDNSEDDYFPREDDNITKALYDQGTSGSCVFASGVWYNFTYEINRKREVPSNSSSRRYIPNAFWNHDNNGNPNTCSGMSSLADYLMQLGAVSEYDWGNRDWQDYIRWLSGYDKYLNGMHNRISGMSKIKVGYNGENLSKLKHFINDHGEGSLVGGLLTLTLPFNGLASNLPYESNHSLEIVMTTLAPPMHAITVVGYCDYIKYDFNNDGLFTNDIDITGDGIVDMRDWEIGGLKLANSYGTGNGTNGFWWLPYRLLVNQYMYSLDVIQEYTPGIVLNVKVEHHSRKLLTIGTAYGPLANSPNPSLGSVVKIKGFILDGGLFPMKGNNYPDTSLDYDPIEATFDFSFNHPGADIGKVVLFTHNRAQSTGSLNYYSLIDYRWGEVFELVFTDTPIQIPYNISQYYGIEYDLIPHEAPIIENTEFVANMVSRFNPRITANANLNINEGVRVDMYNSTITCDETTNISVSNDVTFLAKRGNNKLIIKGNATIGTNVKFIAEEGATLEVIFENPSLVTTLSNCTFERTSLRVGSTVTLANTTMRCNNVNTVIVNRGGKLILNNSLVTSDEDRLWRGIEVWGNTNALQLPNSNQGVIELKNGTVIENAKWGVRTWKAIVMPQDGPTSNPDLEYYGGIVWADGAIFRNNIVAIEFMPYQNFNYSYIKNCSFETNNNLYEITIPENFIKLNNVTDIKINSCSFSNIVNTSDLESRGSGIFASDADVLVQNNCTFNGLYRGIYALGIEKQRTVRIEYNQFSNTVRGAYISNMDFANINVNTFNVWDEVVGLNPAGYSLYINASTGFTIEQNSFMNTQLSRRGIGLIVNESGSDNNQVYKNYFEKLNYATIAQGQNRYERTGITGLCYKCNTFFNNDYDIKVVPRSQFVTTFDGIAANQGSDKAGAGNIFTSPINIKDISNTCGWINYYKHQNSGGYNIIPSPVEGVTVLSVLNTTFSPLYCPSHFQDQIDKEALKSELNSSYSLINDTELALNNVMIRDVMVANPHSAKSDELINMLGDRTVPMSEEMVNEILQGQTTSDAKEVLEADLTNYPNIAWYNIVQLYNLYASDSILTWSSDSITQLIENHNTLQSRIRLALLNWSKGNETAALNILSEIPTEFTLSENDKALLEKYATLLNTLSIINSEESLLLNLETLLDLINQSEDKPAEIARNLLISNNLMTYYEPIKLGFQTKAVQDYVKEKMTVSSLRVYPNPADDFITVSINNTGKKLEVEICDLQGKTISCSFFKTLAAGQVIDIKHLPAGSYMLKVSDNKGFTESTIFVVK